MITITPEDFAAWHSFVGRSETVTQYLDGATLRRFLLVLGGANATGGNVPPMAHWAYFLPMTPNEDFGPDGHPRRGGFLPPISLPRRMFASGAARFLRPLTTGSKASCTTRITDLTHKIGRSGDLVFVEIEREVAQSGRTCLTERQTIAYRQASATVPAIAESDPAARHDPVWSPGPIDLFRFSAVTFNAHRIHYDLSYARDDEGYPGLVVHGPLTASMLCRLAALTAGDAQMAEFSFRAAAPLFADQPVRLRAQTDGKAVNATAQRQDGQIAVTARAIFH